LTYKISTSGAWTSDNKLLAKQFVQLHIADKDLVCLQDFSGGFKKRAEDLDVLEQTSHTWKTQLSAEIKRASSSEARVAMLDVRLVETRAKVDKLAAQVAELEEEQVCALCMLVVDVPAGT